MDSIPEFATADHAIVEAADFIAHLVHATRRLAFAPVEHPADVQAAMILIALVLPVEDPAFRSDRFYALAVDVADGLDRIRELDPASEKDFSDMAESLRAWAAEVEREFNGE